MSWRDELSAQLRLAGPVVLVNLLMMLMGAVDAAVAGEHGGLTLAAVGVGHTAVLLVAIFGIGVMTALDPLVAQAHGAGDDDAIRHALQRGVLLAAGLGTALALVLVPVGPLLRLTGQPEAIVPDATAYARIVSLGLPFLLVFFALRQTLQALGLVRPLVLVGAVANVANLLLDRWLMLEGPGRLGLGAPGCAAATVVCQAGMVATVLLLTRGALGRHLWPPAPRLAARGALVRMLALGVPVGLYLLVEGGAFNGIGLVMAPVFGPRAVAAHRVAMVLISLSFMVPLGIGAAAAVRVGHAVGAGDPVAARRAARVALALGAAVMVVFAALFGLAAGALASLFTDEPGVARLAVALLPAAAAFQLGDGLQAVAAGVLRGVADVRFCAVANVIGHWGVGLPLGVGWVVAGGGGPAALWWGLAAGLSVVALALLLRVRRRFAGELSRVVVEAGPTAPAVRVPADRSSVTAPP